MLSCDLEMLRKMKQVIDEGFAASLSDGLRVEHNAWRAHNRQVTPEAIADRRAAIQERGRAQSS
jgi:hypothetical protein